MPALDAYLHYRMVDVSSVKELARRWYPRAYYASPGKRGGHRALADILESVEELRYYREADLRARSRARRPSRPGPIAARIRGEDPPPPPRERSVRLDWSSSVGLGRPDARWV